MDKREEEFRKIYTIFDVEEMLEANPYAANLAYACKYFEEKYPSDNGKNKENQIKQEKACLAFLIDLKLRFMTPKQKEKYASNISFSKESVDRLIRCGRALSYEDIFQQELKTVRPYKGVITGFNAEAAVKVEEGMVDQFKYECANMITRAERKLEKMTVEGLGEEEKPAKEEPSKRIEIEAGAMHAAHFMASSIIQAGRECVLEYFPKYIDESMKKIIAKNEGNNDPQTLIDIIEKRYAADAAKHANDEDFANCIGDLKDNLVGIFKTAFNGDVTMFNIMASAVTAEYAVEKKSKELSKRAIPSKKAIALRGRIGRALADAVVPSRAS